MTRLNRDETLIADHLSDVTILFADLIGFTALSSKLSARDVVGLLNGLFSEFDRLALSFGVEKIKTVGEAIDYIEKELAKIRTRAGTATVEVVASVDGTPTSVKTDGLRATVIWHLLGALTDEARFEESNGRPGIWFQKRVAGSASL